MVSQRNCQQFVSWLTLHRRGRRHDGCVPHLKTLAQDILGEMSILSTHGDVVDHQSRAPQSGDLREIEFEMSDTSEH